MKTYKMLQMMSTSRKINAIFKREGYRGMYEVGFPIVGVALVEDTEGQQAIKPMMINDKGLIEFLEEDQEGFFEIRPESKGLNIYTGSEKLYQDDNPFINKSRQDGPIGVKRADPSALGEREKPW